MNNGTRVWRMKWSRLLVGVLGLLAASLVTFAAAPAQAGTTIDQAVILDPYDPVPGIAFNHCYSSCGGWNHCRYRCHRSCYDRCGERVRCERDCYPRRRCGDDCYAERRDRCDGDRCGDRYRDGDRYADRDDDRAYQPAPVSAKPCLSGQCFDAERYEHRWRDGSRKGHEWLRRGSSEHDWQASDRDIDNGDDSPWNPPPPPPPPPPAKK